MEHSPDTKLHLYFNCAKSSHTHFHLHLTVQSHMINIYIKLCRVTRSPFTFTLGCAKSSDAHLCYFCPHPVPTWRVLIGWAELQLQQMNNSNGCTTISMIVGISSFCLKFAVLFKSSLLCWEITPWQNFAPGDKSRSVLSLNLILVHTKSTRFCWTNSRDN